MSKIKQVKQKFNVLKSQAGFTLLELLVVIAILAVVAGGVMAAYDGLELQSKEGQSAHTTATVDSAVRVFTNQEGKAPNDLDSLIAVTPNTSDLKNPGVIAASAVFAANLPASLADKLIVPTVVLETSLPDMRKSLAAAGIETLRYIDLAGNSNACAPTCGLMTLAHNGALATVGKIKDITIPNRLFDFPQEGTDKNRGRGFSQTLATSTPPLAIWKPGAGGIDIAKLGANPGGLLGTADSVYTATSATTTDVLVAVGLGNNASIFNSGGKTGLAQPPAYGNTQKNEYNRYVLLYNVGSLASPRAKAKLQAVVDTSGHFLDETLAEFSGQTTE